MKYDTIVIGSGPGGYLAAERLGEAGKKTLIVEKQHIGGTCLNCGCIPTKSLLNSAKQYVHAVEAKSVGVNVKNVSLDWAAAQAWKKDAVAKLSGGVAMKMKKLKVNIVMGMAEIVSVLPHRVKVTPNDGSAPAVYEADSVIIATGSSPVMPPILGLKDNKFVVDSTGMLEVGFIPKKLCIIGGGVIGVEFASLFGSLGSKVTVIEMMDEIIPFMDRDLAPVLRGGMHGVDFKLGCKVEKIDGNTVTVSAKSGATESYDADLILMAVGRRANTTGWGAEVAGLDVSPRGVVVDDRMRTNVPNIWAIGDVNGRNMLAHSAYRMAEVAVADILGKKQYMRYNAIPWAVYGMPEAAGVGITEQEAKAKGISEVKTASIPMVFSGRFVAENGFNSTGIVKLIVDAKTRRILGIHAVGAYASEFIWGGSALIEQEMTVEDVKELILPHPTVCELIRDAACEIK